LLAPLKLGCDGLRLQQQPGWLLLATGTRAVNELRLCPKARRARYQHVAYILRAHHPPIATGVTRNRS
jgi:hypothetical protein